MFAQLRHRQAGEPDYELIWLALTISTALASFAWLSLRLPWPHCQFRALFGVPCLTCGSTRAALAFLHGDLAGAWRFNPLASIGLCGIAVYDLYALAVVSCRASRLRISATGKQWRIAAALFGAAALLNWIYLLRHG